MFHACSSSRSTIKDHYTTSLQNKTLLFEKLRPFFSVFSSRAAASSYRGVGSSGGGGASLNNEIEILKM